MIEDSKGRGRPLGFRLSEESKRAISTSKKGQKHSELTKEKISKTLISYFKNVYPLSTELYEQYKQEIENSEDVKKWFRDTSCLYDETLDIYTERSLNSKRFREISIEYNINMEENPYLYELISNPETLCEIKEICSKLDISFDYVCRILNLEE
ncbi:hypothetical protein JZU46_00195 [bacterium]|nr:hypothetical protein [bacterium]